MGYYNDQSLDYTGEDAFRARMDGGAPVAHRASCVPPIGVTTDSDMAIPAAAAILAVAKEQRADSVRQNDGATVRQLDRVIVGVSCGAQLRWVLGDLHVGSVNNPGVIYILSCGRCPCRATKPCWHLKLLDILLEMQDTAAGDADFEADADELAMQLEEEDGPIMRLALYDDAPARPLAQRLLDQADALLETLRGRKAGLYGWTPRTQRLQRAYALADRRYARRLAALACDGDIDFSQDAPSVGVQLAALGMRRALGWEDAQLVMVTEFQRSFPIRVMPIDSPRDSSPRFSSYADAKMRYYAARDALRSEAA